MVEVIATDLNTIDSRYIAVRCDCENSTAITMIKFRSDWQSQTTPNGRDMGCLS